MIATRCYGYQKYKLIQKAVEFQKKRSSEDDENEMSRITSSWENDV